MRSLLALLVLTLPLPAIAETVGALDVARPAQWDRRLDEATGTATFFPFAIGETPKVIVMVIAPEKVAGTAAKWLETAWSATVAGTKVIGDVENGEFGEWRHRTAQVEGASGKKWVRLYAVKTRVGMQGVLYMADTKKLFKDNVDAVDKMMREAGYPGKPFPKMPKVKSAWRGLMMRLRRDASGTNALRSEVEHLVVFENGTAVLGWPDRGLATQDWNGDPAAEGDFLGSWTETETAVRFVWHPGHETLLTKKDGELVDRSTGTWVPMADVDGSRPEGTFVREDPFQANRLVLRADGTFEEDHVLTLLGNPAEEKLPMKGRGTYEIRAWTLVLSYDDGVTKTIAYEVTRGTAAKPEALGLNVYELMRTK